MALSARDPHDQDGALEPLPASPSVGPHPAAQTVAGPLTDDGRPTVQTDSQSRRALEADSTLRCLYKARVTLDSRLSRPVIALADSLVETFCRALPQSISGEGSNGEGSSGEAATVDKRLIMLELHQRHVLICFDLFLEGCDAQLRTEVEQSDKRPIYAISQRDHVYRVRRWKAADKHVATRIRSTKESDKGELPYFADALNPPVYTNGVRLDGIRFEDGKLIRIEDHTEVTEA